MNKDARDTSEPGYIKLKTYEVMNKMLLDATSMDLIQSLKQFESNIGVETISLQNIQITMLHWNNVSMTPDINDLLDLMIHVRPVLTLS